MPLHRPITAGQPNRAANRSDTVATGGAWVKVAIIFFIALIARLLDAAPGPQNSHPLPETATSAIFSKDFPFILALGPGLAFVDDKIGYSFNINGASQLNVDWPVFVGMDAALNVWRDQHGVESDTAIQLLPTAYYLFEVMNSKDFYPYFGISVGPNVMVRQTGQGDSVATKASLNLSVLFRTGFAVSLAPNAWFHFEPKFGLMSGRMIFLPQVTAAFLF